MVEASMIPVLNHRRMSWPISVWTRLGGYWRTSSPTAAPTMPGKSSARRLSSWNSVKDPEKTQQQECPIMTLILPGLFFFRVNILLDSLDKFYKSSMGHHFHKLAVVQLSIPILKQILLCKKLVFFTQLLSLD